MTDASLAPPPAPDPAERRRDRLWLVGVLAIAVVLTLVASHWTQAMWTFTLDQVLFRTTAIWVPHHLPGSLWDLATYQRGTQRLSEWVQAVTLGLFGSPDGFRIGRWVFVLAYGSTVAPVWLLARRAGAERIWAAFGALAAIVVPWAILSGTFLTEPLAYPLFAWAMYACWGSAVRGGWRWDLLALVAIGAASLARTGMVLLVGVLAFAVVVLELRVTLGERSWRELPRSFAQRHGVLLAAFVIGGLLAAAGLASRLRGSWYSNTSPNLGRTVEAVSYVVSVLGPALAFTGALVGIAFALTQLVRAATREQLGLAVIVLGAFAMMVLTFITGPIEERYVFYWAAPVAAAFAVGASRRSVAWWAIALSTALLLWALHRRVWWPLEPDLARFLLFPSETWLTRIVRLGVPARLPGHLSPDTAMNLVVVAGAVVAGVLSARLPRWAARWARPVALAGGAAIVLAGVVQTGWVLHKYRAVGGGGAPLAKRAWIDPIAKGRTVGLWLPPAPAGLDPSPWLEARYYNLDLRQQVRYGTSQDAPAFLEDAPVTVVTVDPATGRVVPPPGGRLPDLFAVAPDRDTAPLRGVVLARESVWNVRLVRPFKPVSVSRIQLDGPLGGVLRRGEATVTRVYPAPGAAPGCLVVKASGNGAGPSVVSASGGRRPVRVPLARGAVRRFAVPLRAGPFTDVTLRAGGTEERLTGRPPATAAVAIEGTARCR